MLGHKISESTKINVFNAIETRILKPMDLQFSGDADIIKRHSWWISTQNNWNIVCWGGVARVGLIMISDQIKRDKYISEAFNGAQSSWSGWLPDGFNHEGNSGYKSFLLILIKKMLSRRKLL